MSSVSNGMEIETAAVEIAEMVNMETVETNSAYNEVAAENQPNTNPEVGGQNNTNILNTFGGDTEFGGGAPVAAPVAKAKEKIEDEEDDDDKDLDAAPAGRRLDMFSSPEDEKSFDKLVIGEEVEDDVDLDAIENILELPDDQFPKFTLAKNKARFLRMVSWYRQKEEWIEVAPLSGVTKLFKQQTKELEGIRSAKLDYEMELETGTLTPSQRSYRKDELKMCRVQEKMAVHLIAKLQLKIKSGRR